MVTVLSKAFVEFPREEIEQSICSRFARQVRSFPNQIAVRSHGKKVTYDELDRFSNRVAHTILDKCGVKEEPVALLFDPGVPMVAAILGVLKAGKFFLPLDPTSPNAHNAVILDESRGAAVLADKKNRATAAELAAGASRIIAVDELPAGALDAPPAELANADTPAYVLYTSGSTGRAKGVLHSHRNVLHAIRQHTNSLKIDSSDRLSLVASYGRIAGVTSLLRALLNGAALCIFNLREEGWGELLRWLVAEEITIYQSVPTLFRHWAKALTERDRLPKLRLIHLGGEPVTMQDVTLFKKYFEPDCVLLHNLGSTEISTYRQNFISKETPLTGAVVPVGYAVEDKEVTLVDESERKVGVNEVGEIVVKSRYLAVAYWRNPELTRTTFLPEPGGGVERVFHTGDLGRLRPDGCLEHLGRKDRQVKIRGIRIEPAEVEAALAEEPSVRQAVVVAGKDSGGYNQLIAYVIAVPGAQPSATTLRKHLRKLLPEYIVPSAFITLDQFPLTPGGKIDQMRLPPPGPMIRGSEIPFAAPESVVEKTVARIWEEVLGVPGVGLHDRFLDLGGNSLKAMQVVSRLQDALGSVLPLGSLFTLATVAQQVAAIEEYLGPERENGDESRLLAELEAMSEEEAEQRLAALGPRTSGTNRKTSQWQTEWMTKAFLEVRSAFPGSDLQLEVMLKLIRAWRPFPRTALDLGCGDGFLGRTLIEHFPECHVCFVDFSEPMLDAAREKLGGSRRATVIQADFTTPDWAARLGEHRAFDLVVSGMAIHHQPDARKRQIYAEIYGLLAKGGLFLNLEQVASATESAAEVYYDHIIDHLHAFHTRSGSGKSRDEVAQEYYSSPARKENILALVETQCLWLKQIGFQDVDCFFKIFDHALFGGRKTVPACEYA